MKRGSLTITDERQLRNSLCSRRSGREHRFSWLFVVATVSGVAILRVGCDVPCRFVDWARNLFIRYVFV